MPIIVNLDVVMAQRKISATQLAEKVGITLANLSILKNNKAKAIRFSTLEALCRALHCQPAIRISIIVRREINESRPPRETNRFPLPNRRFISHRCSGPARRRLCIIPHPNRCMSSSPRTARPVWEKREHPDSANRQTGPAAASKSPAAPPAIPTGRPNSRNCSSGGKKKLRRCRDPLALPSLPRLKTPEYLRPDTTSRFPVNREQTTNTLPSAALLPKARWPSCFPFCSAPFLPRAGTLGKYRSFCFDSDSFLLRVQLLVFSRFRTPIFSWGTADNHPHYHAHCRFFA